MPLLAVLLSLTAAPSIADAAFIAGAWRSTEGGARSEEVWMAPAGNQMMGMWRYVEGGKARVLEVLTITAEDGQLVLRLRHFDGALAAREEKDRPLVLSAVRRAENTLRFEGARVDGGAGTLALTYVRTGEVLTVTLEKDGTSQPFTFRRAGP